MLAVDQYLPFVGVVQASEELDDGGLSRAVLTLEGYCFVGFDEEAYVTHGRLVLA